MTRLKCRVDKGPAVLRPDDHPCANPEANLLLKQREEFLDVLLAVPTFSESERQFLSAYFSFGTDDAVRDIAIMYGMNEQSVISRVAMLIGKLRERSVMLGLDRTDL